MNQQEILTMKVSEAVRKYYDKSVFIISKTSYDKLYLDKETQRLINCIPFTMKRFTSECHYEDILGVLDTQDADFIVGLGGGTAIDFAKYIAKSTGKPCVAIPSMLSTNVFATNKVALFTEKEKHTVMGVLPDTVILDYEYLNMSRLECLYGLVDAFSIFNALRDWQLANIYDGLEIDEEIYNRAENLLEQSLKIGRKMFIYGDAVDENLFNIIKDAGYITNDYGSGRPESGSEHIFASALEVRYKHDYGKVIPHAVAVAIGILIMTYFFNRKFSGELKLVPVVFSDVSQQIRNLIIDEVNTYNLRYSYIFDVLNTLEPRTDKYTLVNKLQYDSTEEFTPLKRWLEENGMTFCD